MIRRIDLIPSPIKLLLALCYDLTAIIISFLLAYFIRMNISNVEFSWPELAVLLTVSITSLVIFYVFGIYRTVIRYFDAKSAMNILTLLCISSLIFYLSSFTFSAFVPRSVPIIFFVFSSILICGARAIVGFIVEKHWFDQKEGVVIYGASSTGVELARVLSSGNKYQPLAFIDEKKRYQGRSVSGVKVLPLDHIQKLINKYGQFKVLIAVSKVDPIRMKQIVELLEPHALELLTIPSFSDIVSGKRTIDELREISIDELLGRKAVLPIPELLNANILNQTVMVTGAGGSIGKELCRQILVLNPLKLIIVDISEASLYEIDQELNKMKKGARLDIEILPVIGNVQNAQLMSKIISDNRVNTIYHAAAYKHVPLVENNIFAGISNNVMGTYELALASVMCEVETFILISTDKAVRPTNIMGATKRLAELVLQGLAKTEHKTRFAMVRFGNVLGSSGSVVPLFKEQIKNSGPITLTHPDIIRYFMTIPEAAQLVLQAGSMGKGGDVFVLDMGKPVKIIDLAYKMTHLMGLTIKDQINPNGDISIECTGLRPGEKLYEELLIGENVQKTKHKLILSAYEKSLSWVEIKKVINDLNNAISELNKEKVIKILIDAPIDYMPKGCEPNAKNVDKEKYKAVISKLEVNSKLNRLKRA
ncbi:polysaccharide biosynthesis protein [Pseudoalteromonas sp. C2R02]|uniref:polysaccharide biosynthesis protein n=1 Tax=Pseudoalteromonas sp. C2R02 TaxID=2841565 RepID=UPI001C09C561|nr:nucleoside-diphosphate sugar epimerase/dehydratase [Pseudoalteromonas sp. C2R02]MBU2968613.1 polysaccharide biosynthesis protein [Pseudoalteromonas sp. C2R02]